MIRWCAVKWFNLCKSINRLNENKRKENNQHPLMTKTQQIRCRRNVPQQFNKMMKVVKV